MIITARRAGSVLCSALVTSTFPWLSETWRDATKVRLCACMCFVCLFALMQSPCLIIFVHALNKTEARRDKVLCDSIQTSEVTSTPNKIMASWNTGQPYFIHGTSIVPRDGRSYSASSVPPPSVPNRPISYSLHAPPIQLKTTSKRSPKLWPKRNAHVTPLNGPAPSYAEWPAVGFDPLEEFSKLHEYYGNEVKQLRADWLKKKREEVGYIEEDLIDLG